ncbi:MAG TPA: alpha/beta fold hydrolase [Burkholderiaceae bacterium]
MQSIIEPNPWLVTQRRPNARLRLYCFSYAGGSANVYLPWKNLLDGSIELCAVQLPGRGARLNEMPVPSLQKLVADIAAVISNETRLPFAFFGHSLGGLLAFELTRYCKHHLLPSPGHLIVSGCSAPQMRDATQRMHLLPDEEFIEELRKYNGTPPEILAHRELMQLVLPALRADFAAVETYQYKRLPPFDIPITVFAGRNDNHVSEEKALGWELETRGPCEVHWFDGDHFFLHEQMGSVLETINSTLSLEQSSLML